MPSHEQLWVEPKSEREAMSTEQSCNRRCGRRPRPIGARITLINLFPQTGSFEGYLVVGCLKLSAEKSHGIPIQPTNPTAEEHGTTCSA